MSDRKDDPPVEIYLGEEELEIRRLLRSALRDLDLDIFHDYASCGPLRDAVREGDPDLIIVDSDLDGGDAADLVEAIRHQTLGTNPFVPVIVTMWESTAERVRRLIDSGADVLLIKPVSISTIQNHVNLIVNSRKPFIVTSSYIGPDRRKDPEHTSAAPLIEVPNTLKAKLSGESVDSGAFRQLIAECTAQINEERLRRNAFELSFLVEMTLSGFDSRVSDANLKSNIERIHHVAADTATRIQGSAFEQCIDLCDSLVRVVTMLVENGARPARRDLQFLKPLTDAILTGFNPGRDPASIAREIVDSIGVYEARQIARAKKI